VSEHPILFSAPMVRAILDGRKTQTRRVLTPQPVQFRIGPNNTGPECDVEAITLEGERPRLCLGRVITGQKVTRWAPGDRLWVKEGFAVHVNAGPAIHPKGDGHPWGSPIYRATFGAALDPRCEGFTRWRPSIHMPRWASRITLAVEAVRVERLQDIGENEAPAEGMVRWFPTPEDIAKDHEYCRKIGVQPHQYLCEGAWLAPGADRPNDGPWGMTARDAFHALWNAIHGPDAWDANPWVSVTTFRRKP